MPHGPCPQCGSSDACFTYDDGHAHCFAMGCAYHTGGTAPAAIPEGPTATEGMIRHWEVGPFVKRGIDQATAEVWKTGHGEYGGRKCHVYPYYDRKGRPVAQKVRFEGKQFLVLGDLKRAGLFGESLWRDGGRMVVVTEGELDALSVSQAQGNRWPVASVPTGASGARGAFEKSVEWLESFEKVVIMFDDDEPGRAAARECAQVLSPGKAYIATIQGFKDANEALLAREYKAIVDAAWGAKAWRPDEILSFDAAWQKALTRGAGPSFPLQHAGLQAKLRGLRPGEITVLVAGTGTGKSTSAKETAGHLAKAGVRVGYIGLEEGVARTALGLASVLVDRRLHLETAEALRDPSVVAAAEVLRRNVVMYDAFGSLDPDNLLAKMRFMALAEKCAVIFLDHLSIVVSGDAADSDERRTIDRMMTRLTSFVNETKAHVFAIAHLSRQKGTPHEEGRQITLADIRGSHGIAQLAYNIVAQERDQQSENDPDLSVFRVLKCREIGDLGVAGYVRFNRETGRQVEVQGPNPVFGGAAADDTGDVD